MNHDVCNIACFLCLLRAFKYAFMVKMYLEDHCMVLLRLRVLFNPEILLSIYSNFFPLSACHSNCSLLKKSIMFCMIFKSMEFIVIH